MPQRNRGFFLPKAGGALRLGGKKLPGREGTTKEWGEKFAMKAEGEIAQAKVYIIERYYQWV